MAYETDDGIAPPQTMTVDHDYKPVLFSPDGRAMVRRAGFMPQAIQTTGTNPPLSDNTSLKKKGGKKRR